MYKTTKKIFDKIFALFFILLFFPILLPVMFLLKFTAEGEVFYLQERVGYHNKRFHIYKFATMLKNSSKMKGGIITTKNDPRVTNVGKFLRKTKINELPQLLNILFGHMSFVGPRPLMPISFETYPEDIQKTIYDVRPGLTGIGSIIFRDEEELLTREKNENRDTWSFYKNKIYPFKGNLEIWYQKNQSFIIDLKIILVTAWVIINTNSRIFDKIFNNLPRRDF